MIKSYLVREHSNMSIPVSMIYIKRADRKCHEVQYCVSNTFGGKLNFGQGTNLLVHTSKWFCI